jgi:hypothetical protein
METTTTPAPADRAPGTFGPSEAAVPVDRRPLRLLEQPATLAVAAIRAVPLEDDKLLSREDIAERLSLSPTEAESVLGGASFPCPIELSPGIRRWRLSDLERWLAGAKATRVVVLPPGVDERRSNLNRIGLRLGPRRAKAVA